MSAPTRRRRLTSHRKRAAWLDVLVILHVVSVVGAFAAISGGVL